MTRKQRPTTGLPVLLRALKLPAFSAYREEVAKKAESEGWTFDQFLQHLAELELEERRRRRIKRLLKASQLPAEKTLGMLEVDRFADKVKRQLSSLCTADFVERAENVLAFGLPGRGKSHLVCAIGHELTKRGYAVLFTQTYQLVQRLLAARRDLALEYELRRLDRFDVVILDDIGYVQQDRDEMEVLFTFFGERYERRSVIITSNLVFSQWDRIFKDPMTTAAAIDRLVHHATIIELNCKSYRSDKALSRTNKSKERTDEASE